MILEERWGRQIDVQTRKILKGKKKKRKKTPKLYAFTVLTILSCQQAARVRQNMTTQTPDFSKRNLQIHIPQNYRKHISKY